MATLFMLSKDNIELHFTTNHIAGVFLCYSINMVHVFINLNEIEYEPVDEGQ